MSERVSEYMALVDRKVYLDIIINRMSPPHADTVRGISTFNK